MRKRNLLIAVAGSFCLAVFGLSSAAALADEAGTEAVTDAEESAEAGEIDADESAEAGEADAEEDADGAEAALEGESETDGITEAEKETELVIPERPDYSASDYVTLGQYKGLTVVREPFEVTEEEIDEEIQLELQYSDALETVTEGVVQEGDIANIDYEGKKDGVAFDGGTDEGFDLTIGSHMFIDGFEDGLIGVAVGDTVDLPLTFPENYGSEELAGADVVFTVTVNEIKRVPELTDEVASTVTDGEYNDVASYRESVRAQLEATREQELETIVMSDLMTQIANTCEITGYPQEMIDYNVALMEQYYRSMAQMYSMEFEDFLSTYLEMTLEQFQSEAVLACQEMMQQELYLKAIAEAEGIELTDEEYIAGTERYAQQYGYETAEALVAANDEKEIRISLLLDKVYDFLLENSNIVDAEPETESENMTELTGAELVAEAGETEAEAVETEQGETETEV